MSWSGWFDTGNIYSTIKDNDLRGVIRMSQPSNISIDLPRKKPQINERQKALVDILVRDNCSIEEASKRAGYKASSARNTGAGVVRLPHVKEYMMQQVQESFGINSLGAVHTLQKLSREAKSEYVQMESAKDILDRAGFKAPDKHQHQLVGDFKVHIDLG
jgi:hypothetical protein